MHGPGEWSGGGGGAEDEIHICGVNGTFLQVKMFTNLGDILSTSTEIKWGCRAKIIHPHPLHQSVIQSTLFTSPRPRPAVVKSKGLSEVIGTASQWCLECQPLQPNKCVTRLHPLFGKSAGLKAYFMKITPFTAFAICLR